MYVEEIFLDDRQRDFGLYLCLIKKHRCISNDKAWVYIMENENYFGNNVKETTSKMGKNLKEKGRDENR